MTLEFQGAPFPPEGMRMGGRWSVASPLRTRHVAALMEARGVEGEHAPRQRRGITERPQRAAASQRRQRPVGGRGRLAATDLQGTGAWRSRARAGEQPGHPRAWRLTAPRAPAAALRWLPPAIRRHGLPETRPIDGREAQAAASQSATAAPGPPILIGPGP